MKTNKLKKFETKTNREPSPEAIKQAREVAANMIMSVFDRLPENSAPVAESLEDFMKDFDSPKRAPVIVQTHDGKRVEVRDGITKIISGENENPILDQRKLTKTDSGGSKDASINTGFTLDELELLRKIENGE